MEAESPDGLRDASKAEMLRGIVAEKLTAAAQEILAVVERTVAGYEEEASGLRREIELQRRQLELLLQPRIKQETTEDQFPVCQLTGGGGEEEQHKYELSVKDTWSLLDHTELQREDAEEEEEEEEEEERPALSSTQNQDHLTEPDQEVASRFLRPSVRSDRKKRGRPRVSVPRDHIDLKVRILEDSQIQVLSASVFKKYPVQEVRCSRGLQEADFLDLLRSTFPQLAAQKPFDVFTTNRSKRLQPIRAQTLTPEVCRGSGHSALYIRLKAEEEVRASEEELPDSSISDQSRINMSSSTSRRGGGKRRRRSRVQTKLSDANADASLSCKVCHALRASTNMLIKHSWSHVDDPQRLCGVCGEHSESADQLRTHLQTHQKTHSCNICGKSFLSVAGFNGHVALHNGKKPYQCMICQKAFAQRSSLWNHKWVHAEEKPHKCDFCHKLYVSKLGLKRHRSIHTGERRQEVLQPPYPDTGEVTIVTSPQEQS